MPLFIQKDTRESSLFIGIQCSWMVWVTLTHKCISIRSFNKVTIWNVAWTKLAIYTQYYVNMNQYKNIDPNEPKYIHSIYPPQKKNWNNKSTWCRLDLLKSVCFSIWHFGQNLCFLLYHNVVYVWHYQEYFREQNKGDIDTGASMCVTIHEWLINCILFNANSKISNLIYSNKGLFPRSQ